MHSKTALFTPLSLAFIFRNTLHLPCTLLNVLFLLQYLLQWISKYQPEGQSSFILSGTATVWPHTNPLFSTHSSKQPWRFRHLAKVKSLFYCFNKVISSLWRPPGFVWREQWGTTRACVESIWSQDESSACRMEKEEFLFLFFIISFRLIKNEAQCCQTLTLTEKQTLLAVTVCKILVYWFLSLSV